MKRVLIAFSAILVIKTSGPLSLFVFAASGPAAAILGIAAGALIYKYYSNKNETIHLGEINGNTRDSNMLSNSSGIGMDKRRGITPENGNKPSTTPGK